MLIVTERVSRTRRMVLQKRRRGSRSDGVVSMNLNMGRWLVALVSAVDVDVAACACACAGVLSACDVGVWESGDGLGSGRPMFRVRVV
jgi:hypothetical protein